MVSAIGLLSLGSATSSIYNFAQALMYIGWGIIGLPKIWIIIKGGGLRGAVSPSYEVVTTYGDGSRSSDGGAESAQMNLFAKLIQIGLVYVIGGIVQIIHQIVLTVRYMVLHGKAKPKPAFIKSGMFIIVLNIAVFIGSFVVGATIQKIGFAVNEARDVANHAKGTIILIWQDSKIYERADLSSSVIGEAKSGDRLTSAGEYVADKSYNRFVSVNYNNTKGWVLSRRDRTAPIIGTATVTSNTARFVIFSTYDENRQQSIYKQDLTLKKGDTFEVTSSIPGEYYTDGVYNNEYGFVPSKDVKVKKR